MEGVTPWRLNRSVPGVPVLYEPCVAFVVQGNRRGFLGERTFIYSPNSNLVLTAPLPFECETQASAEVPLLCLYVRLRRETIAELLASISPERMPPPVAGEKVLLSLPYRPQLTEEPFRATIAAAEAGAGPITVVASTAEPRART